MYAYFVPIIYGLLTPETSRKPYQQKNSLIQLPTSDPRFKKHAYIRLQAGIHLHTYI